MFKKTIKLLRKKYPKAKIVYAAINWKFSRQHKAIKRHKLWYQSFCKEFGCFYMKRASRVMVGHKKYFEDDLHHPNALGADALSRALYKDLRAAGACSF